MLYYDIELEDKTKNRCVSYMADSYSINDNILRIHSFEFENVTTRIEPHEHISITPIEITNDHERNL